MKTFDDANEDNIFLNFEDNAVDGKYLSFSKINLRLSRVSNIELLPSRTIPFLQYERLIEVIL